MPDWTVAPDKNYTIKETPRVLKADYNNGYSVRAPNGINNMDRMWSLNFANRDYDVVIFLEVFLDSMKGCIPFTWIPPDATAEIKVVCESWSKTNIIKPDAAGEGYASLSTAFKQVY